MRGSSVEPFAPAVIKLLQGPLFSDDAQTWNVLLRHLDQIRIHCAKIGLELHMQEEDGFAYLIQPDLENEEGQVVELPRLTRRIPLNYPTTVLCVLLREQLLQFEASNLESTTCILTRGQIHELLMHFLPERSNELLEQSKMDALISRVVDLGFLKRLPKLGPDYFEVRRILKAKIDADRLVEIKERLQHYGASEE
ncbi:DUF4194 domain-containing protein [Ktedonobacter robiniae]|uniref:DUF4194 domain-containing protein n=1 Tax=Ktedonobacter robiniae TaxID=2778365 RepID=A0ABQ3UM57_9CHLR|nr:DUF4194 domain-containing protein [Ktedonobacter robiniae]GHO53746.1 hypothetical protein KSB_22210 [Ktedonobacter robiniae]